MGHVIVRLSTPDDRAELERLAALDSAARVRGQALVAESGAGILAAVSLETGEAIAHPFVRTAELLELLRVRAAQLGYADESRRRPVAGIHALIRSFARA